MIIKYYGLYDSVAKTLISTFTAANDEVCLRSCEHIAADPKSDAQMLKDCIVQYLYSVDSESGTVVDITKRDLVAMAAILEKSAPNIDDKTISEIKEDFAKIKEQFDKYKNLDHKCLEILDLFDKHLSQIEAKVDSIIKGEIKCQKYKKPRKK